jgi:hypothetical protein
MPVVTKYICDGCGIEKGICNHWFLIASGKFSSEILAWTNSVPYESMLPIFCGEKCVLAALSKWMQERKDQDTDTGKG